MDKIYAFDKTTKLGTLLGEIQTEFNMSFVIDGSKDSSKIVVHSWDENEIEPYTIIYHANTQTWWIVSHDKVERYQNESGFLYIHNLTLLGAIELCNARDLTDCGFNQNTYTIGEFITRLFSLSNFEYNYNNEYFFYRYPNQFIDKKVKFVKTFQNYTLLSALREFLDGYNMVAKLGFDADYDNINDTYTITVPYLYIISKTGEYSNTHDLDSFDDTRETKTMGKNSFGSIVISNAENVMSSIDKTFPELGAIRPSSSSYEILAQNGFIRLPSDVYKANWLKLVFNIANVRIDIKMGDYSGTFLPGLVEGFPNPLNYTSLDEYIGKVTYVVRQVAIEQGLTSFLDLYLASLSNNKQEIYKYFLDAASITLYNGNSLNPVTREIVQGENVPYIPTVIYHSHLSNGAPRELPLIFCDKETRDTLPRTWQGISWERGKNQIFDFNAFEAESGGREEISITRNEIIRILQLIRGSDTFTICSDNSGNYVRMSVSDGCSALFRNSHWIVNYIPMSDIKIKTDNDRNSKDVQLYNQNGRLNDGVALSKLINSYSKEISSDTITRYMQYYSYDDIPKVGDIVYKGNIDYVINNVSLDFMQNENETYYIEAEITMSKYVSTKTLLVSPDSNIRDYGIPQNFNVKRKQLYRDVLELNYAHKNNEHYLSEQVLIPFKNAYVPIIKTTAVIKLEYSEQVENSYNWYYQLDTINYIMAKSLYIVCDFNDNNIIGYSSQNVFSGFDITRIFNGLTDTQNTPISYVDNNGNVKGFDLLFLDNEQLTRIYNDYEQAHKTDVATQIYEQWRESGGSLYNYSPFIPEEIYEKAIEYNSNYTFRITENNYYKDAIEVPVFEYSAQFIDNEDVLIGDGIFNQHEDCIYFYSFVVGDNFTQQNVSAQSSIVETNNRLVLSNAAIVENPLIGLGIYPYEHLIIRLYSTRSYYQGNFSNGTEIRLTTNKDLAIFRHAYNQKNGQEIVELMFILKNIQENNLYNEYTICPAINCKKLN